MLLCRRTLWRGIQRLNFSSNAPEGSLPDFGPVAEATGKKQKLPDGRTGWQFAFKNEFSLFKLPPDFLPPETLASKEDLLQWYRQVCEIRRMEMAADAMYKAKLIRGFCHLSIGQEAIPVGIQAALDPKDAIITAYRCHGFALMRGASVRAILAELLGRSTGVSRGKGGSMHMYADQFYGGNGIVGAQVPLGAGIAFAQKYRNQPNVTFALYGDGAANQGQVFEAYNFAWLHKLPVVFVCENNWYGMGTSAARSSASTAYYTRGDYIPGIRVNGMDVLAMREASRVAKQHALEGKGPIVMEAVTYRYGGHSMSDPGTTYRTRDEIQSVRTQRDVLRLLQAQITGAGVAMEEELKQIDRSVKAEVDEAAELAKNDPIPDESDLMKDVYTDISSVNYNIRGCEPPRV